MPKIFKYADVEVTFRFLGTPAGIYHPPRGADPLLIEKRQVAHINDFERLVTRHVQPHVEGQYGTQFKHVRNFKCSACGILWTEKSETYNGGCCDDDQLNNTIPNAAFKVGDLVEKASGYRYPGVVRSVYTKADGATRYDVEADHPDFAGMIHIFSGEQLRARREVLPGPSADEIERIARAICRGEKMNEDDPVGGWTLWIDAAREVIADRLAPSQPVTREVIDVEGKISWQVAIIIVAAQKMYALEHDDENSNEGAIKEQGDRLTDAHRAILALSQPDATGDRADG